jgi:hypothetical protein
MKRVINLTMLFKTTTIRELESQNPPPPGESEGASL